MAAQQWRSIEVLITLANAMLIKFGRDGPAARAVDRAVEYLSAGLPYEFDGVEFRVTSVSYYEAGRIHVTDGVSCTCAARRCDWCWHRAAHRLLLAEMSLGEPTSLRARILEQVSSSGENVHKTPD